MKKIIKKVEKNGNKNILTISYKTKFIDSYRFIASSLSNPVENHVEKIHKK